MRAAAQQRNDLPLTVRGRLRRLCALFEHLREVGGRPCRVARHASGEAMMWPPLAVAAVAVAVAQLGWDCDRPSGCSVARSGAHDMQRLGDEPALRAARRMLHARVPHR